MTVQIERGGRVTDGVSGVPETVFVGLRGRVGSRCFSRPLREGTACMAGVFRAEVPNGCVGGGVRCSVIVRLLKVEMSVNV